MKLVYLIIFSLISVVVSGCNLLAGLEPQQIDLESVCNKIYLENRENRGILGTVHANEKYKPAYYTVNFTGYYDRTLDYPSVVKDIKDKDGNVFYKIIIMYQYDKLNNHSYKKGDVITVNKFKLAGITDNLYAWKDTDKHYCRFDVTDKLH